MLQTVMGTMIPLIKWAYLDYQNDPEERERWFRIIPRNNIPDTANTMYNNKIQ